MARFKGWNWHLPITEDGRSMAAGWDGVAVAVLMDIRDELKTLNAVLACPRFIDIPNKLDRIERNTKRKKAKRRA